VKQVGRKSLKFCNDASLVILVFRRPRHKNVANRNLGGKPLRKDPQKSGAAVAVLKGDPPSQLGSMGERRF